MKNLILVISLMCASVSFAGGGSSIGVGNPASQHCLDLGGELESFTTDIGEGANCVMNEWTLFRAMIEKNLTIPHHYDGISMPNPAAVNCADVSGTARYTDEENLCVVEQWALFRVFNVQKK